MHSSPDLAHTRWAGVISNHCRHRAGWGAARNALDRSLNLGSARRTPGKAGLTPWIRSIAYALAGALLASSAHAGPNYYEPGAAPPYHEVTEADMRALATRPQGAILPPLEYDHPFAGRLLVMLSCGQFCIRYLCKREWPISLYGCAVPKYSPWARTVDPDGKADCIVIHATEAFIDASGLTLNLLMRHEIGHCNGWPSDHRGAR
jgi:hypothetical protein